jgi:hypothetical protein
MRARASSRTTRAADVTSCAVVPKTTSAAGYPAAAAAMGTS